MPKLSTVEATMLTCDPSIFWLNLSGICRLGPGFVNASSSYLGLYGKGGTGGAGAGILYRPEYSGDGIEYRDASVSFEMFDKFDCTEPLKGFQASSVSIRAGRYEGPAGGTVRRGAAAGGAIESGDCTRIVGTMGMTDPFEVIAKSASVEAKVGGGGSGLVGALYIGGVTARICPSGGDRERISGIAPAVGCAPGFLRTKSPVKEISGSEGLEGPMILPL